MDSSEIPPHLHVARSGDLWVLLCLRCGAFIGAAPNPDNLAAAARAHDCKSNLGAPTGRDT